MVSRSCPRVGHNDFCLNYRRRYNKFMKQIDVYTTSRPITQKYHHKTLHFFRFTSALSCCPQSLKPFNGHITLFNFFFHIKKWMYFYQCACAVCRCISNSCCNFVQCVLQSPKKLKKNEFRQRVTGYWAAQRCLSNFYYLNSHSLYLTTT